MKETLQDISQTTEFELLQQLENKYFAARFIEIGCVLDVLSDIGVLQRDNLVSTSIIDLGTGSGIGLLALRKLTNTHLIGVDNGSRYSDWHNGHARYYEIPTAELVQQAQASFVKQDMIGYLEGLPSNSISLITAFFMSRDDWNKLAPKMYDQLGRVLTPGGQFLLTSDANLTTPNIDWGKASTPFRGNKGSHQQTLVFKATDKIPKEYQNLIKFAGTFLEDETLHSQGAKIGLIRDRNIQILTKAF
jgi:SAM-dependent methyltransferase